MRPVQEEKMDSFQEFHIVLIRVFTQGHLLSHDKNNALWAVQKLFDPMKH